MRGVKSIPQGRIGIATSMSPSNMRLACWLMMVLFHQPSKDHHTDVEVVGVSCLKGVMTRGLRLDDLRGIGYSWSLIGELVSQS